MGVYTYGEIEVEFSRDLTEAEQDHVLHVLKTSEAEEFGGGTRPIKDEWNLEDPRAYGDIGQFVLGESGFSLGTEGKVYIIEGGIQVLLDALPEDVTASGDGMFETEGEDWSIQVSGRKVFQVDAHTVVPDHRAVAQYIITVFDPAAREELQGKIGDLSDEFGSGALDYEVIELKPQS